MFRIGIKLSSKPHNRIYNMKNYEYPKLCLATTYKESERYFVHRNDTCKKVEILLKQGQFGAKFSSGLPKSQSRRGKGLILLSAITVGTVAVLTVAGNDSAARKALENLIFGTDRTIEVILQENGSFVEQVLQYFENIKKSITGGIFGDRIDKEASEKDEKRGQTRKRFNDTIFENHTPSKSTFETLVAKKALPISDSYAEIRSKNKSEDIQIVVEKSQLPDEKIPGILKPTNLVELETLCCQAAGKAISAYQDAIEAISDFNQDVVKVIESDGNTSANMSSPLWQRLKEATEKRKRAVHQAEESAAEALQALKRLLVLVDDPEFHVPLHMKSISRRNVEKVMDNVDDAKHKYEIEERSANITTRYWNKVKMARDNFNEELQILFPNININDKNFSVDEEAFDIFVLYMYNKVSFLQKELEKLETLDSAKLKSVLRGTGDEASEEMINELVCRELNKEKRLVNEVSAKKLLAEKKTFDEEIRRQLKLQAQINADHLEETLETKEKENQKIVSRALSEQAEAESNKYNTQLAVIIGRLQGLDEALKLRLNEEKGACDAQMLWAACQALAEAIKVSPPGASINQPLPPLEAKIKAVTNAAPTNDTLVQATLTRIPEDAVKRGIFPEDALRKRFSEVEIMARRLALVPEDGASLPIHLFSYLQNFLLLKAMSPISTRELSDESIDVSSLDTYDILNRARFWLDRGDFRMALRYMNLLKGASRCVAQDWMNETRILLETQQSIDTLIAYAGAIGLVFLGSGDSEVNAG